MIKVKDIDGKEVKGLYRNPDGTLAVKNDAALSQYVSARNDKKRIADLELQLNEMRDMIGRIINDKK